MAVAYLPAIAEKNYEAFQGILQDAPTTFKDWQQRQALTALGLSTNGWRVEGVEIDPDQFFEECSATQTPRDLHSLQLFTLKIAAMR
jgi:hypothetical protein